MFKCSNQPQKLKTHTTSTAIILKALLNILSSPRLPNSKHPQQRLGEASSLTNSNSKIWGAGLTRCDRQLGGYPAEFWLVFVGIVHPNAKHIAERLLSVVWKYIMKLWVNKYIPSLNFGISFWADPTRVSKRELLCWTWAVGCLGGKLQLVH